MRGLRGRGDPIGRFVMTYLQISANPPTRLTVRRQLPTRRRNIGPAEIARRRRAGHIGALASLVLLGVLLAIGAPPLARLLVALPAAAAASGYLQAFFHFCAGFASRGVFNFGPLGRRPSSTPRPAPGIAMREPDRRGSIAIGVWSACSPSCSPMTAIETRRPPQAGDDVEGVADALRAHNIEAIVVARAEARRRSSA